MKKKHIFCKKITCNQPAKTQSTKSQCLLFIMSGQWRTAISRILASDRFKDKMPIETVSSKGLFMSTRLSWVLFHSTRSSSRPVRVSWHSSNASSVPLLCINHFRREPLMIANKRAKPGKSKETISGLLLKNRVKGTIINPEFKLQIKLKIWQKSYKPQISNHMQKKVFLMHCWGPGYRSCDRKADSCFSCVCHDWPFHPPTHPNISVL